MKTLYEYEASDIKLDGFAEGEKMDRVQAFLVAQMFVIGLTGFKPLPTDPPDKPTWPVQRLVADFLNSAQKAGISIAVAESVPAAYRDDAS